MWAAFSSCTFLSANQCHRFVENIPQHISPKSGFESFAEYTQCVMGGSVRLEATWDITAGKEVYVRHAPGSIQWECFHPEHCTSSKYKYFVFSLFLWEGNVALFVAFVHAVNPYDLAHCVRCDQCFRGIHTACIVSSDSTKTLTCSVCLDSVRRTITTEFDSTLSPAVRFVYLCSIHCYCMSCCGYNFPPLLLCLFPSACTAKNLRFRL